MLPSRPRAGGERIPDTLQALIAARIDRLPADAAHAAPARRRRSGRVFWAGALEHLSPEVDDVDAALDELVERDFVVREARSTIRGEHAFQFKHVLIREVAYAGLSKCSRAELHRAFAAGSASARATSCSRSVRTTSTRRRALLEELDGAAPPELAARGRGGARRGRSARARRARRSAARASCSCARSSSSRRSSAATSPRAPPGGSPTCRP